MPSDPIRLLDYSTTPADPDGVTWETFPDFVRVTIPAPPVWQAAAGLSVVMGAFGALAASLLYAQFGALLTGRRLHLNFSDFYTLIALGSFSAITVWAAWRLRQLPRIGRVPTILTASPTGLLVTTARRGRVEQLNYPIENLRAFSVQTGPLSASLSMLTRIILRVDGINRLVDNPNVVLELAGTVKIEAGRLEAFLCQRLGSDAALRPAGRIDFTSVTIRRI